MADISASTVMELRQRTGLGMMECKKALTEAGGDLAQGRGAAAHQERREGVEGRRPHRRRRRGRRVHVAPDAKTGAIVEVNCETDFVAKNDDFMAFAARARADRRRDRSGRRRGARRAQARVAARPSRRVAWRWCRRSARTCRSAASQRRAATGKLASLRARRRKIGVLVDVDRRRRRARQGPRDAHRGVEAAAPSSKRRRARRPDRAGAADRGGARRPSRASPRTSSRRWSKARSRSSWPR